MGEVAARPAASRTTAPRACAPSGTNAVFQLKVYGPAAMGGARSWPSRRNCTAATPAPEVALAETVTGPDTKAPCGGVMITMRGSAAAAAGEPGGASGAVKVKSPETDWGPAAPRDLTR